MTHTTENSRTNVSVPETTGQFDERVRRCVLEMASCSYQFGLPSEELLRGASGIWEDDTNRAWGAGT